MSPGGRADQVGFLRDAIARIEANGRRAQAAFAPAGGRGLRPRLGETGLDQALKGRLGRGALHEIVAASPGDAAAASGFALALATRFAAPCPPASSIVWIIEDQAKAEAGLPYAPGLAIHGLDPRRLIVVATASGQDTFWAMEEALRCKSLAAVVAEVWRLKTYDLAASRRLHLAAQKSGTPGLLIPAGAAGEASRLSSAARTRFEVRAMPGPPRASAADRTPIPGPAAFAVRIARIRAGPGASPDAFDRDRFWPVLWDHEEACFRDALPLPVSARDRDRPDSTQPGDIRRRA